MAIWVEWWFCISHMLHGAGMSTFTPSTMAQHPFPSLETRLWWRSAPKNGSAAQKSRGRLLIVATSRREVHGFQQKSCKSYYKMWWNQDGTNRWFVSPHEAVSQFPGTGQFLRHWDSKNKKVRWCCVAKCTPLWATCRGSQTSPRKQRQRVQSHSHRRRRLRQLGSLWRKPKRRPRATHSLHSALRSPWPKVSLWARCPIKPKE